jgi:hypothetical protein
MMVPIVRIVRKEGVMKVGVIGVGGVGAATVLSLIERGGMCRQIVVVDRMVVTDPPDPLADLTPPAGRP